ncbi:MAG: TetR/AcrR family transcriptional regulator [bacterium]
MEVARQLFFQQGYNATGIAQILKTSNAYSGSLYHFFQTKEDLLAAVLEKYKAMLKTDVLQPAFARASDPIERLFAVLDGYRRLLQATDFHLGCPIGNLALEVSNSYPLVRRLITENFEDWCQAIENLISAASGRLPLDTNAKELSRYVLATMEGAVMLARAHRSFEPFDAAINSLRNHFDRLLQDGSQWSSPRQESKSDSTQEESI